MKEIIIVLIIIVLVFLARLIFGDGSKSYTDEEWEDQCSRDFRKYGPVPDDEE